MSKRKPVSILLDTSILARGIGRIVKKLGGNQSDALNIVASEILGQNQNWGALLHKEGTVVAQGMKNPQEAAAAAPAKPEVAEAQENDTQEAHSRGKLTTWVRAEQGHDGKPYLILQSTYGNEDYAHSSIQLNLEHPQDRVGAQDQVGALLDAIYARKAFPSVVTIENVTFFFSDKDIGAVGVNSAHQNVFPGIREGNLQNELLRYQHYKSGEQKTSVTGSGRDEGLKLTLTSPGGNTLSFYVGRSKTEQIMAALTSPNKFHVVDAGLVKMIFSTSGITGFSWDEDETLMFPNIDRKELAFALGTLHGQEPPAKEKAPSARDICWERVFSSLSLMVDSYFEITEFLDKNPRTHDEIMLAVFHATQKWMKQNAEDLKDLDEEDTPWAPTCLKWEDLATMSPDEYLSKLEENFFNRDFDLHLIDKLAAIGQNAHQPAL